MAEVKEIIEDENKIDTVLSEDIEFKGILTFKNSLKIKGKFEGKITTDGHLIIGREATVSADIKAREVSNSGIIHGKIKAGQSITLFKKSQTRGDILSPDISIENGAAFNGTCLMEEQNQ